MLPEEKLRTNTAWANDILRRAFSGRDPVRVDRFASAGRNAYSKPSSLWALRPSLAISYYDTWGEAQPNAVLVCEKHQATRHVDAKHHYINDLYKDALIALSKLEAPPSIIAWYETKELRSLARLSGGELLSVSAEVRNQLEDKSRFDEFLQAAGVPKSVRINCFQVGMCQAF